MACQVLPYAVDHKMEKLVLFMEEQRHCEIADLLLRVFGGRDEVDRFQVAKVDIPPKDVDVQELANIFFLVVAIQIPVFELLPYVCKLLVDSLLF